MARTLRSDKMLFVATLVLVAASLVMVYSASVVQEMNAGRAPYGQLLRQSAWVLIGLPLLLVASRVDYRHYRRPAVIWTLLAGTAALLVATFFSPTINHTQRWLSLGGLTGQPSELAKLVAVCFAAALLDRRMHRVNDASYALLPIILVTVVFAGLIVLQPDFGTAVMLVLAVSATVFAAGLSWRHVATAAAVLVPTALLLILISDYRLRRLLAFLNPFQDPTGDGFQLAQSLIAIGSGGAVGKGLMAGVQKAYYIPEPENDFIYAVIGEELGLIGTTLVLVCFGVIAWRGLRASVLAPDRFGALLAFGITALVTIQALLNISVVLGLLPTKGIPLPFVSYGGSALVVSLLAMGVLLNVSQHAAPAPADARGESAHG